MRISNLKLSVSLLTYCLIAFLVLGVYAAFGHAESLPSNIVLLTQLGKSEYAAGEPVRLNVTISNASKDPLPIGGSASDVSTFDITVQNAKGETTPLTHYGKDVLSPPSAVFMNYSVQVPAGGQRRYQFNLSRMFDLSRRGDYFVSVKRVIVTGYKKLPNGIFQGQTTELVAAPVKIQIIQKQQLCSGTEPISSPPLKRQYLYLVTSRGRGDNDHGVVVRYQINADGTVSPTLHDITRAGKGSKSIVIGRDGKFAYVLNGVDDSISQFGIGENGVLTPLPQATVSTDKYPAVISIDPTGQWVIAASTRGARIFRVGMDGALTPIKFENPHFRPITNIVFSPDGHFVYMNNLSITQSRVEADGSIVPLSPSYVAADNPRAIAIDSSGHFLYVLTNHDLPIVEGKPHASERVITPLKIETNGTLSQLGESASPRDAGIATCCLNALYVNGRYLYAVNETKGDILQYEIGADGKLKFETSNFVKSAGWSIDFIFDNIHHFAYAANYQNNSIATYKVNSQGGLKPFGINVYNDGGGMGKIAIVQAPTAPPPLVSNKEVEMSVRMERDVYNPDVPVILTVTLKGIGAQSLRSTPAAADMARFEIIIKNEKGETMPLLSRGKEILNAAENNQQLAAAKERQYRFVLNRLFDITRAGIYTVIVKKHAAIDSAVDHDLLNATPLFFKIDNPYDKLSGDYLESLPAGYHYANGIGEPLTSDD